MVILLAALAAPLLLLPLEVLLPYPHLIEELVKAGLLLWLVRSETPRASAQWEIAVGVGALFTLSETILYLNNFMFLGNGNALVPRLVLTGVLHVGTSLLVYLSLRRGWLVGFTGLILAVAFHYLFNFNLGLRF